LRFQEGESARILFLSVSKFCRLTATRSSEWDFLNKAERNDKIAVRDAMYAYFEKYLDPETPPPPT
jgi:hypothetical protein